MTLTDAEKAMCKELGVTVAGSGLEALQKSAKDMEYAGFGVYISPDHRVFEKVGGELVEVTTPELDAEKRFLDKYGK